MAQSPLRKDRLPILLASIGVGALLIAGGVALSARQNQAFMTAAIAATQTASSSGGEASATPTLTATATPRPTDIPTPTPNITAGGSTSLPPTAAPTDTPSPTPVPARPVTIGADGYPTPSTPPITEIPPSVEPVDVPSGVINIALLGSDKRLDDPGFRTDTIIIVSVNTNENTVNMLSLPRDLLVYVPGWTMNKLNTAYQRGETVGWPGGGFGLLKETLLYNLGITVHHYAFVDLSGFKGIVDTLDGIEISVDCAIQGYRLRSPVKEPRDFATYDDYVAYTADESNWEMYTLPVGVHHLDGYMAMWYARVRQGYSDFDRSRRQQQVLRAILTKAKALGLTDVGRIDDLWRDYNDLVQTDMGLGNLFKFADTAANLDSIEITSYILTPDRLVAWNDPSTSSNDYYLLPRTDLVQELVGYAMQPPAQNYVVDRTARVEIRNGTPYERLDEVAADRLAWEGLTAIPTGFEPGGTGYTETVIYDFTGRSKTSQLRTLQRILRVGDGQVIVRPDPDRVFDYVVILGLAYQSCTYNIPQPNLTPTPSP